jgi:hypothetical protein
MNVIASLLIVMVIGVGGHRHEPLYGVEVHAVPTFDTHEPRGPLLGGVTDRHGRARINLAPGRYVVSVFRKGRLCLPRKVVTLTGGTKRVTLTCHIR